MLDLKLFREHPDRIRAGLAARGSSVDIQPIIDLDSERRGIIAEADALKNERKTASKKIGELKKAGEDAEAQMAAVRELGDKISAFDARLSELETELHDRVLAVPNLLSADTPAGLSEEDNVDLGLVGELQTFDFDPLPHWELGERLGLFDFPRGARMSGSGFPILRGQGARLSRGLIQFMLDLHTTEHGYTELAVPFLCNSSAMTGTGQLPKFKDDQYGIDGEDLWLIPTAEVPLTNFHNGEILDHDIKAEPVCLTGYTPCFRKGSQTPRPRLPPPVAVCRRRQFQFRAHRRPRTLGPRPGPLARGEFLLQFRRLPSPPRRHQVPRPSSSTP